MSMTIKQHVDHWINSSDENMKDMSAAIKSKRRENALYSGHQALEKILKAVLAAQNKEIAHIHRIERLTDLCGIIITDVERVELTVGDDELVKIHYHTNTPWKVLEYCASLGDISDIVVENMERQANGLHG